MSDDTSKRLDDLLAGRARRPEPSVESAVQDWLNDVGIKDAADWLTEPSAFNEGYATAILSLCASLPPSFLDYAIEARSLATLDQLRQRADADDRCSFET